MYKKNASNWSKVNSKDTITEAFLGNSQTTMMRLHAFYISTPF